MICVLGVFNADLKFTVDQFPAPGQTLHSKSFAVQAGGKGFNQAVAAKRAGGGEVSFLSAIGKDQFGDMAQQIMAREGLDASMVSRNDHLPTGTAGIVVEESSAQNMIIIAPGAASSLDRQAIAQYESQIAQANLFVTNLEVPVEAAVEGLRLAKKHGVTTVLDPAPAQVLPFEAWGYVDYVTPNESEAAQLVGDSVEDLDDALFAGRELCDMGVGTAIVTMGEQGAVMINEQGHLIARPYDKGTVVDTTGAGDAFNGAFIAALAMDLNLEDALTYAMAGASLCIEANGAAEAMGHQAQILERQTYIPELGD